MPKLIMHRIDGVVGKAGEGVTDAIMVQVRAYAKSNAALPYNNANESICSALGRVLGLPIPPHGFVFKPSEPASPMFASLDFNIDLAKLPPLTNPAKLATDLPDITTGLVLFDIWIGNPDRHAKNLNVDFSTTPPRLFVFDHGHALLGYAGGQGVLRLTTLEDRLASTGGSKTGQHRHCLLDHLATADYFEKWIDRIKAVPTFLIQDLCQQAMELGIAPEEARAAERFLLVRQGEFKELIMRNKQEFSGIKDWGMFNA